MPATARAEVHANPAPDASAARTPSFAERAAQWATARAQAKKAWDRYAAAEAAALAMTPPYPAECAAHDRRRAQEAAAAREAGEAEARRIARLPQPVAAGAWRASHDAIEAAHGLPQLDAAGRHAAELTRAIAHQVLATPATALADLAAKVKILSDHMADEDLDRAAELAGVASVLADLQALSEPPAPPSTETLEAYNAWLHMERRLLALEMYPELGDKAERFIPCGTPGDDWHFRGRGSWRDHPQPSTRAASVLHALGILPEAPE